MKALAIIAIALGSPIAAADPVLGHVITAPTAWLPRAGVAFGSAGLDHRLDGSIDAGYGFADVASIELGADTDVRSCTAPPCSTDKLPSARWMGHAAFRIGAHQDAWFHGQPALVVGVTTTLDGGPRTASAYVVASRELGALRLHAGVEAIDGALADERRMGAKLRPLGAAEWTPPQYPLTTLMVDFAWLPLLERPEPVPEWVLGWGVRYQALRWGSIELDVRHRESEGLAASTVMVRVNGVWAR